MRGRLKKERSRSDLVVVGDEVELESIDEARREGVVATVLPRRTKFSRRRPGPHGEHFEDVIAANVDRLWVAMSATTPAFSPGMVDRFIGIAEVNGVEPVIVMTKCEATLEPEVQHDLEVFRRLGYEVLETSSVERRGLDALAASLEGQTVVIVGQSGAGKSTLVRALDPRLEEIEMGEVSDTTQKGRHTTRVATLYRLGGGWLVDTPGIRELASFAFDAREIIEGFRELRDEACQFNDCLHRGEPGCAVAPLVGSTIDARRFRSYQKAIEEHLEARRNG